MIFRDDDLNFRVGYKMVNNKPTHIFYDLYKENPRISKKGKANGCIVEYTERVGYNYVAGDEGNGFWYVTINIDAITCFGSSAYPNDVFPGGYFGGSEPGSGYDGGGGSSGGGDYVPPVVEPYTGQPGDVPEHEVIKKNTTCEGITEMWSRSLTEMNELSGYSTKEGTFFILPSWENTDTSAVNSYSYKNPSTGESWQLYDQQIPNGLPGLKEWIIDTYDKHGTKTGSYHVSGHIHTHPGHKDPNPSPFDLEFSKKFPGMMLTIVTSKQLIFYNMNGAIIKATRPSGC